MTVMMVRRFVVMSVCFMILVFFASCKNDGGGGAGAGNSASALTAEQFAVASTRALSNAEFTERLIIAS